MAPLSTADRIVPVLPVSDVPVASQFFRDNLGFTIRQGVGDGWGWAVVCRGTSEIMLVPKDWPPGCSIRVDDVDAIYAELRARHAEFESGPMNQEYGQRDFLVCGPDGYAIRFYGPLKTERGAASPPDKTGDESVPF
jgi:catechol 2,3-dioxygenase-like lactoylglutathione lyase family enzyme